MGKYEEELKKLKHEHQALKDSMLLRMLEWRDIDPRDCCQTCGGCGSKTYGNTSTWRNGIGGQMMTRDICDRCWGSGNINHPWVNLKISNPRRKQ